VVVSRVQGSWDGLKRGSLQSHEGDDDAEINFKIGTPGGLRRGIYNICKQRKN
jgi:hypothetical protein